MRTQKLREDYELIMGANSFLNTTSDLIQFLIFIIISSQIYMKINSSTQIQST